MQFLEQALQVAQRDLTIALDQYRGGTVRYLARVIAQTATLGSESSLVTLRNRQLAAERVVTWPCRQPQSASPQRFRRRCDKSQGKPAFEETSVNTASGQFDNLSPIVYMPKRGNRACSLP